MKKTIRLLAVLLTLCLLVGSVAIVSSAATVSQLDASQYGKGISSYLPVDFENYDSFSGFQSSGGGKYKDGTTASFTPYASYTFKATLTEGEETNTFFKLTSKDQETN